MRFSQIILWLCLMLAAAPAFGQAVVLRPEDVLPRIKDVAPEAFYINGHDVHGMTDETANTYYPLGDAAKFMLALVALRLADEGVISLDEPVAKALPSLIDFNPFEVAITPKHLMAETAGFARPIADINDAPLRYYLITSRGAGQISLHDPIGWRLLQAFLEKRTDQPVVELLAQELLTPLGLPEEALIPVETRYPDMPATPLSDAVLRGDAVAAMARLLLANEDASGAPFLTSESYGLLTTRPLWQMHPLGFGALAGSRRYRSGSHEWVQLGLCRPGVSVVAFPASGVAYIHPSATPFPSVQSQSCAGKLFRERALSNATANIPPTWSRQEAIAAADKLLEPETLGGRYQCANVSAWVKDRVEGSATCRLTAHLIDSETLTAQIVWPPHADFVVGPPLSRRYQREAPYAYRGSLAEQPLIFSPYRAGGYAYIGDMAYVRVGVLGYFRTIAGKYIPLMIVILLTGALHIRSKTSVQWRRFGWFCLAGATLVGFGVYADWYWWPTVLYQLQMPWLITLWRTGLNIGLMLLLALPMLSMTFIRQQNMPERGVALLFAGPHLGLMSLAAIGLFLTTIIWGIAGTFTAY
ncbi:serine hydrolase domain-containing protein [Kordiimonas lipolytica]|uniref:Serine hydrolase domain-containing protein n=1 Tax=Kordiimonas lipolytica TaxID=1662421 RepID=A0ABV8U594_9PROT|nr:serine hydrolase domain-containing protein [Kordiimonas lipolytica]